MLLPVSLLLLSDVDGWAKWRGPNDDGMARGSAPIEWSDTKNVAWKRDIPGRGMSSPIVWGDRIFLTTAIPNGEATAPVTGGRGAGGGAGAKGVNHKFVVYCIDRNTGKTIWETVAATLAPHEGYHFRYGSYASNTPVTDGKLLYAFFGSFGLYALDFNGKIVWKKSFPAQNMRLEFGEGVPLTLHDDRLFVKLDSEHDSYMQVYDKTSGKELWRVDRAGEPSSWSPPLVVTVDGKKQIVTSATNKSRAYDWDTGKIVWEAPGLGANVIPAPVVHRDIVVVMSGFRDPNLQAIRLDGKGTVVWSNTRGNSYTPSPVLHNGLLYFVTDNGQLSCFDVATGQPHYRQQRLPKPYNFKASPVGANGNLYLATEVGDVVVVKMGTTYEVVATNTLENASFIATPAIVDGMIYLRSQNALYAIGTPKP